MNGSINQAIMDLSADDQKRLDDIKFTLMRNWYKTVEDYNKAIEENSRIFREEMVKILNSNQSNEKV